MITSWVASVRSGGSTPPEVTSRVATLASTVTIAWKASRPLNASSANRVEALCTPRARAERPAGTRFERNDPPDERGDKARHNILYVSAE
jgi:hypothetical protein